MEFYKHYASFEALEKDIFDQFAKNTIALLNKDESYGTLGPKDKYLSFLFTFFETLTANRSFVLLCLDLKKNGFATLGKLKKLKSTFDHYITGLDIETWDTKHERLEKLQQKSKTEVAWTHLLTILRFWMTDSSPAFEKTDLFIEKSVRASFDLLDISKTKSVVDLAKFLVKEVRHS
ncbi:hypothetical protein B7P33_06315 [Sediminicola luteus]|uniref:Tetracyclin repressor-like C-terminal domain-containing protein n=2 Tax=Sediminicola luteus TaxID=319238 RepID=A0A2A4G8P1_9FLAO|nr:hypothetical protein B7P33_06315 [Sediminicola luteus]